jgi:hypothetical protein
LDIYDDRTPTAAAQTRPEEFVVTMMMDFADDLRHTLPVVLLLGEGTVGCSCSDASSRGHGPAYHACIPNPTVHPTNQPLL